MFWIYLMLALDVLCLISVAVCSHAEEIEELIIELTDIIEERKRLRVE